MDDVRTLYDRLNEHGPGQMIEQGEGNYYRTNAIERRALDLFLGLLGSIAEHTGDRKVLIAGCGEGLEAEVIAQAGWDVVGFDLSPNTVAVARERVGPVAAEAGVSCHFTVDDVTTFDPGRFAGGFAGAVCVQVLGCLPVIGSDELLRAALGRLTAVTRNALLISTTRYLDDHHIRSLHLDGKPVGSLTYHGRTTESLRRMVSDTGLVEVHAAQFTEGPGDFTNQYVIGVDRRWGRVTSPRRSREAVQAWCAASPARSYREWSFGQEWSFPE